jgi:hypothetical protein
MTCVAGDKATQASSKLMGAVMVVLGNISMGAQRNTKRWVPPGAQPRGQPTSRPAGDGLLQSGFRLAGLSEAAVERGKPKLSSEYPSAGCANHFAAAANTGQTISSM